LIIYTQIVIHSILSDRDTITAYILCDVVTNYNSTLLQYCTQPNVDVRSFDKGALFCDWWEILCFHFLTKTQLQLLFFFFWWLILDKLLVLFFMDTPCINSHKYFIIQLMHSTY